MCQKRKHRLRFRLTRNAVAAVSRGVFLPRVLYYCMRPVDIHAVNAKIDVIVCRVVVVVIVIQLLLFVWLLLLSINYNCQFVLIHLFDISVAYMYKNNNNNHNKCNYHHIPKIKDVRPQKTKKKTKDDVLKFHETKKKQQTQSRNTNFSDVCLFCVMLSSSSRAKHKSGVCRLVGFDFSSFVLCKTRVTTCLPNASCRTTDILPHTRISGMFFVCFVSPFCASVCDGICRVCRRRHCHRRQPCHYKYKYK